MISRLRLGAICAVGANVRSVVDCYLWRASYDWDEGPGAESGGTYTLL